MHPQFGIHSEVGNAAWLIIALAVRSWYDAFWDAPGKELTHGYS